MNSFTEMGLTLIAMLGTIALAAILVSRNSQTPALAQSVFSGIGNDVAVAQSPVTGANVTPNLSYPDFSAGFGT